MARRGWARIGRGGAGQGRARRGEAGRGAGEAGRRRPGGMMGRVATCLASELVRGVRAACWAMHLEELRQPKVKEDLMR